MMRTFETIILGGGVSGISFGLGLTQKKHEDYLILESNLRPGGKISSIHDEGYLIENGPNSLMAKYPQIEELIHKLDFQNELIFPRNNKRYLNYHGNLMALGPKSLIKLLDWDSYKKLLSFGLLCSAPPQSCETVAQFIERTLGTGVLENLVKPFVSGIHAGNVDQLMIETAFPKLYEASKHSFFLPYGLFAQRNPKSHGMKGIFSFKKGIHSFIDRMAKEIPNQNLRCGETVLKLERMKKKNGFHVHTKDETFACDRIVSTVPAHTLARILDEKDSRFFDLASYCKNIHYPYVKVVHMGFHMNDLPAFSEGFGYLNLQGLKRNSPILGCLFPSSMFFNRAPENHILLTFFVGGSLYPSISQCPDSEIVQIICDELAQLMGRKADPQFLRICDWKAAIPQYNLHHLRFHHWLQDWEKQDKTFLVRGNFVGGISVPDCIVNHLNSALQWA